MASVSPTPLGQGSHFTSLGRRTSARQALRRPPSRSQMGPASTGTTALTAGSRRGAAFAATSSIADVDAAQQAQQYSTLHDSSDDEMPIPMKLSALTKALLSDGGSASEDRPGRIAAAAAAAAASGSKSSGPAMTTRRRSVLNRSTSSSTVGESEQHQQSADRPIVRQTRRHVRTTSTQAAGVASVAAPSSATSSRPTSRPTSPQSRHQDSSPVPRKRVVRLSAATPANGVAVQPPLRRSLSASKHSRWGAPANGHEKVEERAVSGSYSHAADLSAAPPAVPVAVVASLAISSDIEVTAATASATAAAVAASQPMASQPTASASAAGSVNTPASSVRRVQIAVGSSGRSSRARLSASSSALLASRRAESGQQSDSEPGHDDALATAGQPQSGSASQYAASSGGRDVDQQALQSSMRIKRMGKALGGGFLSGPARRGRRRQSEEDGGSNSPDDMLQLPASGSSGSDGRDADVPESVGGGAGKPYFDHYGRDFAAATGSPVSAKNTLSQRAASLRGHSPKMDMLQQQQERQQERQQRQVSGPDEAADIRAAPPPAARPTLPSAHDKENELVYSIHIPKPLLVQTARDDDKALLPAPQQAEAKLTMLTSKTSAASATAAAEAAHLPALSPERKVLAAISRNTPHRPAPPPPPPKMTVLETATAATAGPAATAQANKKPRILLKVNGRSYQRVDCIGRGGSAKVYKVTAENGKMFAMKRVSLESADETTIRGYMGEIDLLKKLAGVDRVIQLFDFEMNKEKQMLSLLMELGEMDLNSLLRVRQSREGARLDPVFVRFYWKEMLECLQAVHAHDIVHSDLKPANFVLVQGRLKLIDFGIANAIQTDETVNVHRETQVGTPSYMSPESLMDAQQYAFTANHNGRGMFLPSGGHRGAPKVMKLGKPSDVWSLGCILYQMVYGLPPFGHIQNQMARCQAIITWSHTIEFPARGLGGAAVPSGLLATMKRCLNREQQLRPTCEELLLPSDPFLYPEAAMAMMTADGLDSMPVTEELLSRIIQSVVTRCRERMPTEGEALSAWPAAYWASVRRAVTAREDR